MLLNKSGSRKAIFDHKSPFQASQNWLHPRSVGAWRSLVAHLFWVQGVVSSNLAAPTIKRRSFGIAFCCFSGAFDSSLVPIVGFIPYFLVFRPVLEWVSDLEGWRSSPSEIFFIPYKIWDFWAAYMSFYGYLPILKQKIFITSDSGRSRCCGWSQVNHKMWQICEYFRWPIQLLAPPCVCTLTNYHILWRGVHEVEGQNFRSTIA